MKYLLMSLTCATLMVVSASAFAAENQPQASFKVAAGGSCREYFSTCAARCKERLPNDKNCTSDHCTPKLGECRQTGCWQEGGQYGGGKTCGLSK